MRVITLAVFFVALLVTVDFAKKSAAATKGIEQHLTGEK